MKTIIGYDHPTVPPPEDYKGNFFEGNFLYKIIFYILYIVMSFS